MKYHCCVYHSISFLDCFQMITSHCLSHPFCLIKWHNEIHYYILHVCATSLHTPAHTHMFTYSFFLASPLLNEYNEYYTICWLCCWMLSGILARFYFFFPSLFILICVSVFSPSLLLTSCLLLALFLWNPVAVLAEKLIWLADRPGEGMPGPPNIWVTFLTVWLWFLAGRLTGSLADHQMT